jgi:hypothetical protein
MMEELIYGPKEVIGVIKKKYPQAKFKDASDFIHEDRFSVIIPDIEEDEFYPFAIKEGFADLCLRLMILLYKDPDKVKGWLEITKKQEKDESKEKGL